jgi:hypothetical protein
VHIDEYEFIKRVRDEEFLVAHPPHMRIVCLSFLCCFFVTVCLVRPVKDATVDVLNVECWDWNRYKPHTFLGALSIPVKDISAATDGLDEEYQFGYSDEHKRKGSGTVRLKLSYVVPQLVLSSTEKQSLIKKFSKYFPSVASQELPEHGRS